MTDGVIKYTIEHTVFDARIPHDIYATLESVRSRLYALGVIGVYDDGIGYGNISVKDDQDHAPFYITATQTGHLAQLGRSHYSKVTSYDFNTFTLHSKGHDKPSSEALSHAMIYELDPAIRAVIHIHSAPLWRFMIDKGHLSTAAAYGTPEMTEEITGLYQTSKPLEEPLFVMKGHEEGIIVFGKSLKEAEIVLLGMIKKYLQD